MPHGRTQIEIVDEGHTGERKGEREKEGERIRAGSFEKHGGDSSPAASS